MPFLKHLRWLIALLASGGGLWFVLHGTDWASLFSSLAHLKFPYALLVIPLAALIEFSLRTLRWQILLRPLGGGAWKDYFPVTAGAFFVNNILPFRAGEWARVWWTHQKSGVPISSCLAVLVVDRIFDTLCIFTLAGLVFIFKASLFSSRGILWALGGTALGALAALGLLARHPGLVKNWLEQGWVPRPLRLWAGQFLEGAKALQSWRNLALVYGLSIAFWAMTVCVFQITGRLFSLSLSWVDGAWLVVAFCLGAALPAAPGYVGTLEAAGVAALVSLGYSRQTAFPFVLTLHACQILTTALLGVPSLWKAGLSIRRSPASASFPEPAISRSTEASQG